MVFSFGRLDHAPGVGLKGLGKKFRVFFSEHGQLVNHIEEDEE